MSNWYKYGLFALVMMVGVGVLLVIYWDLLKENYIDPIDALANWVIASSSLIAVFISYRAVHLLRDTLEETERAVNAADEANKVTQRAFAAQSRPVFVVKITEDEEEIWRAGGFKAGFQFRVFNAGSGTGILKRMCRHWEIEPKTKMPPPIMPEEPPPNSTSDNEVAIGANSHSHIFRARVDNLTKGNAEFFSEDGDKSDHWFCFYGFLDYDDLAGNRYRSGFCLVAYVDETSLGFHIPWPKDGTGKNYNYHHILGPSEDIVYLRQADETVQN